MTTSEPLAPPDTISHVDHPSGDSHPHLPSRAGNHLSLGSKLTIGFGILVLLTLVVAGVSYFASADATAKIQSTNDARVPIAQASAHAQANLLKMVASVRGYLAFGRLLGYGDFRENYEHDKAAFQNDLAHLQERSASLSEENKVRFAQLNEAFTKWSDEDWEGRPDRLFELRDEQLEREPAYQLLTITGTKLAGSVLIATTGLIRLQGERTNPTHLDVELLQNMADFQATFAAMFSGLRGYVTTRNPIFRQEYEFNESQNTANWQQLVSRRDQLTPSQQRTLDTIQRQRAIFLASIPKQMFAILESDRWREDLYLFQIETLPQADHMQKLLEDMTSTDQELLRHDLNDGRISLRRARRQTLMGGVLALILGILMSGFFREHIVGPVRRLTNVAEKIWAGDLVAQAAVESRDEIGILAETFNKMTSQLRDTLWHVQKEKRRADDLLHVVIPIGVSLTSERDFNHLLERIIMEAKTFCNADAGLLFLREDKALRLVTLCIGSKHIAAGGKSGAASFPPILLYDEATGEPRYRHTVTHATLDGHTINLMNVSSVAEYDADLLKEWDDQIGYQAISLLAIPLKNNEGNVLGVLQLINAQDPESGQIIPFDDNLQQMMESLSSLATAALESYIREQSLRHEIQQLRIEIDETKRQQQVSEIVDSDFFKDLRSKARSIRKRGRPDPSANSDTQDELDQPV